MKTFDQPTPARRIDLTLTFVAVMFCVLHLAIAYVMAVVRHVGNPLAAIIYAVLTLSGIGLGYWLVRRGSLRFGWAIFLALGLLFSWGMLHFGNWLLMAFA